MSFHEAAGRAARQHGLVTYGQLRDAGVTPSSLRDWIATGRLERLSPAVYRVAGAPSTWQQRVMQAVLDTGGWASHRTAAALHGLDGHEGRVVEVVVQRWKRSSKHMGFIVHEAKDLRGIDLASRFGIPCTSLVRTLLDLPAVEHPFRVEQALDHSCRLDADLLPAIQDRFTQVARRGRNGTTVMRSLLADRTGVYTPPASTFERLATNWIDRAGIAAPERQHKVEDGDFVAYLDLAWPGVRFGMECDSLEHHFSRVAHEWDRRRRRHLKRLGWELGEYTYHEVKSGAFIPELRQLLVLASRSADIRNR